MKTIFAVILLVGALITSNHSLATNLNSALRTLPNDEEWSIMAHAAAGSSAGESYLRSALNNSSTTDYEKRILAITSLGQNPRTWGNENYVDLLLKKFDGTQMGDTGLLNDDIFGILALYSAGESGDVINKLRSYVLSHQNNDGGWGFSTSGSSDSNTTAMAVAALSTTGSVPGSAVDYLNSTHTNQGGYSYTPGKTADGASTAWVIIGLESAGRKAPSSAITYLESLQLDSGAFKWQNTDTSGSTLTTAYAVIALSGASLPIRVVPNKSSVVTPTPPSTPAQVAPTPAPRPIPTPTPTPAPNPPPTSAPAPIIQPAPTTVPQITPPAQPTAAPQSMLTPTIVTHTPTQTVVQPTLAAPVVTTAIVPASPLVSTTTITTNQACFVSISYPGNIIYVGRFNVTATPFTSSSDKNYSYSSPRAIHALIQAAQEINLLYTINQTGLGPFVHTVNGYAPTSDQGWIYAVNGKIPSQGAAEYEIKPGDTIQWFFANSTTAPY